jgi:hypothetical protein
MKDWIEKNLDPPGMGRKNWRSLFSFIGRVFGIVKDDAIKAHNAFFPYLADSDKLKQHGDALMIQKLPFDTVSQSFLFPASHRYQYIEYNCPVKQ